MNPKKFLLWLFLVSIVMVFGALTSAYIVRQADGEWLVFDLPEVFYASTAVIALSSLALQYALFSVRRGRQNAGKLGIVLATLLGLGFMALQWQGWNHLVDIQVHFVGNPSGSFVYVLTGLHAAHVLSGVIFLLIALVGVLRMRIQAGNATTLEMATTYWHFLGLLWGYLFIFLLMNR